MGFYKSKRHRNCFQKKGRKRFDMIKQIVVAPYSARSLYHSYVYIYINIHDNILPLTFQNSVTILLLSDNDAAANVTGNGQPMLEILPVSVGDVNIPTWDGWVDGYTCLCLCMCVYVYIYIHT